MEKDFEAESVLREKGYEGSFVLCARVGVGGMATYTSLLAVPDSSLSSSFKLY